MHRHCFVVVGLASGAKNFETFLMFAGGGAGEGGGGEAGAGAGAGRGPGSSSGASGGGGRKRRPHRAAASALAPSGGVLPAHAAPPQPVRVEREAGSPPPELKPKRKKAKLKSHDCTTGLWRRVPDDPDRSIDHAAIPAPQCTQKSQCSLKCCAAPGFSQADIMSFRELARVARGAGGKAGLDAFLLTYMQRKVKRSATSRTFAQLPVISDGYVKGGCAYCNTIEGAIDRRHTFRKCPRHEEGLVVADSFPVFAHNFFLPPVEDGTARREVSASFFRSVFQLSKGKIVALQKKTVTKDVNRLLHNTGHHGQVVPAAAAAHPTVEAER